MVYRQLLHNYFNKLLSSHRYIGRQCSASTATGTKVAHEKELSDLLDHLMDVGRDPTPDNTQSGGDSDEGKLDSCMQTGPKYRIICSSLKDIQLIATNT